MHWFKIEWKLTGKLVIVEEYLLDYKSWFSGGWERRLVIESKYFDFSEQCSVVTDQWRKWLILQSQSNLVFNVVSLHIPSQSILKLTNAFRQLCHEKCKLCNKKFSMVNINWNIKKL